MKLKNGLLYVADEGEGIEVLDVSDPTKPKETKISK